MRKFFSKKKVIALLMATCFMMSGIAGMLMAEETETIYENIDEIITVTCSQKAPETPSKKMTTQFYYWDELLLCEENKNGISGDLAVASVALANAAYNVEDINVCIDKMGFTKVSKNNSYNIVSTYEDNDRVAYSISRKNVKYNGEQYGIYLVPIRGTHGNAEWYSNFNIGTKSYHQGFYIAADEVVEELKGILGSDKYDKEHTILWTMGHSRGAAISNIIAGECGWDEDYVIADNVYAYTYACPSVNKNVPSSTANIYNFNNISDLVPTLPLQKWGFKRYGQTIELDMNDYSNFTKQFARVTGKQYETVEDANIYVDALIKLMPTQESANAPVAKILMDIIAGAMSGDGVIKGFANSYVKNGIQLGLSTQYDWIMGKFDEISSIIEWIDGINDTYASLIKKTQEAIEETKYYDEEKWAEWLANNENFCKEIYAFSGLNILQYSDLQNAVIVLNENWDKDLSVLDTVKEYIDLFLDRGEGVKNWINHGHTPETYTLWINSMYYGYQGWYNNDDKQTVTIDDTKKVVGSYCFYDCDCLTDVKLTSGVRMVGESTFYSCDWLETVLIPATASWLDNNAFAYCTDLKRVTMPIDINYYSKYVSNQQRSAFYGAKTESIIYSYGQTGVMPDRQTTKSNELYYGCTLESMSGNTLKSVTYAEGITNIGAYANQGCKVLTDVNIPESVTKIGERAFEFCEALGIITIPDNVTDIGEAAFHSCSSLKIVNLSKNITEIKKTTFKYCEALTTINLPEGITIIKEFAFYGCESLGEIVIPNTVTYLEEYAFSNCLSLKKVTMPVDITYLSHWNNASGHSAFMGVPVEEIVYTYGKTGVMPDRHTTMSADMYYEYTLEYIGRNSLKKVTYSEGITNIGDYELYQCNALMEVNMAASIAHIGEKAFNGCISLADIDVTKVNTMGKYAFYNCDALTKVIILSHIGAISEGVYGDCDGLKEVTMEDGITTIGPSAFNNCDSLEEIVIPDTVTYVEEDAFSNCLSLKKITMPVDITYLSQWYNAYAHSAFMNVPIEEIVYTYGQTGVMPDKHTNNSENMCYRYTLEYLGRETLKNVTYNEGIKYIGKSANEGCSKLTTVSIPDTVEDIGAYAFYDCDSLSNIVIPSKVKEVQLQTFYDCDRLINIVLPEGVTTITNSAFYSCDSLEEIVIPDSVTYMEENAFSNCKSLKKITMPVDITYLSQWYNAYARSAFMNVPVEEIVYTYGQTGVMPDRHTNNSENMCYRYTLEYLGRETLKKVTYSEGIINIGVYELYQCKALTTVNMTDSIANIGENAFNGCISLADIDVTKVNTMGKYAFYNCDALTKVTILSHIGAISEGVYGDCDGLKEVIIEDGITTIGPSAFNNCDSLEEIVIPDTVTYVEEDAFSNCKLLKKITMPVDITYLSHWYNAYAHSAFMNVPIEEIVYTYGQTGVMPDKHTNNSENMCYRYTLEYLGRETLKKVTYNEGIKYIGKSANEGCSKLTTVSIPDTVEDIGAYAFYDCDSLSNIVIPSKVKEVQLQTFYDCDRLINIVLPEGVTTITNSAFYSCDSLEEIVIPDSVTYMEENAFSNCKSLKKITMPVDITYLSHWYNAANRSAFMNVPVEEIVYTYGQTGVMPDRHTNTSKDMYYMCTLEYIGRETLKKVTYREGITNIGAYELCECKVLTTVNMAESITTIGEKAFNGCISLADIDVTKVNTICKYAFYNCDALTKVTILSHIGAISEGVYGDCDGLKEVIIEDGITTIGPSAFNNCDSLEEIVIPDTVTYMEENAFSNCKLLKKITMPVDITYLSQWYNAYAHSAFMNVPVEEIVYTYGQTGVMPDKHTSISKDMYYGYTLECMSKDTLKSLYFEDGITNIGNYAAYNCSALEKVRIPESVTTIGTNAFTGCGAGLTIYGYMGSYAESFANSNGINFIKFLYPYITFEGDEVNIGTTQKLSATVYLDMDETTTAEQWSISGNVSGNTGITSEGLLSVATDESAEKIVVTTTYGDATESVEVNITAYDIVDGLRVTDKLKIEGYQISYMSEGSRVIGSVEPEIYGSKVQKWGFIYVLENVNGKDNPVTTADMHIDSENPFVAVFESTEAGTSSEKHGESDTATYFVQTMLFSHKNAIEFSAKYKVRAYAELEDGTYVYSDVSEYTVFDISKMIYENSLMNNATGHEYLFDTILSIVDETFEKIEYDIEKTLVQ